MKQLIQLFGLLMAVITINAQEAKMIKPAVKEVTFFPDNAQVVHEESLSIPSGNSVITLGGLSPYLDMSSVRVSGKGQYTIMSVNARMNYLTENSDREDIKNIREKIKKFTMGIEDAETDAGILREKESFLVANRVLTGGNKTVTALELSNLSETYITGIESARKGILELNRKINQMKEEKQKLENQLNGMTSKNSLPVGEVMVAVKADAATRGSITLSYLVTNAGWYPSYDIRVSDVDQPAEIFYKANVWQRSGSDWENVKVSFSNARPSSSGVMPVMSPWFINFYTPPVTMALKGKAAGAAPSMAMTKRELKEVEIVADEEYFEPTSEMVVSVDRALTNFSFSVALPQTIRTGENESVIELQRLKADAVYTYQTVPKLRAEAFLTAGISDWESLNLIDGNANIYFGNTFTGTTNLSTAQLDDTLTLSLGTDPGITVKRVKQTDLASTRFIGSFRRDTRSFKISLRNNKQEKVTLTLFDQVPVSQDSNIEVEPEELSNGAFDEKSGKVTWRLELAPGESKDLFLTYTVKYPKNRKVILE